MNAQSPQTTRLRTPQLDAILLLEKPTGITSNAALQDAKYFLRQKKAGHTGSLDPLATGMLPIVFGEAAKFSQMLLDSDKAYHCRAQLGVVTTTGDSDGEVVSQMPVPELSDQEIQTVIEKFIGDIQQIPPIYSAIKYQGKPLYQYAREGVDVPRDARCVHIFRCEVVSRTADTIDLFVHCSKGTYIRSLVEDIGTALGCGAHVTRLHRDWVNPFVNAKTVTLEQLKALHAGTEQLDIHDVILPIDAGLMGFPGLTVTAEQVKALYFGQEIQVEEDVPPGLVRLYNPENQFIGMGEMRAEQKIVVKRLVSQSR